MHIPKNYKDACFSIIIILSIMIYVFLLFLQIRRFMLRKREKKPAGLFMLYMMTPRVWPILTVTRIIRGEMLKRWSQAKYAMEVFTAMMDEKDLMRIYPMSEFGDEYEEIKGSDPNRVETVHNWTSIN